MTGSRSLWVFLKRLHVEPILFLFSVAVTLYGSAAGFLANQKLCFPEGPPGIDVVCNNSKALQDSADLNQVRTILRECLPAVVVILAGSWRDITHRSLPLLVSSHLGEMLATTLELVSYLYWGLTPWVTAVLASLFGAIGGSRVTVTMTSLAYVTEQATIEERANRMPIIIVAMLGGMCLSVTTGGVLLSSLDYIPYFITILVLFGVSLLLACILIKDPSSQPSGGYLESIKRLKTVFRARPNSFHIWIFILAISLITSMLAAEGTISFLFLQKKFNYTPASAGFLSGYKMLISLVTAGIATPLLKKIFKLSDFKIAGICLIPSIISCFGMAFAKTELEMYLFVSLDFLRITLIGVLVNLFTGCLKKSEVGIFTSFLAFAEGMLPIALNPLYVYVFKQTVDTLPGAFYCISGCSIALSGFLIWAASCSYELFIDPDEEKPIHGRVSPSKEDIAGA